MKNYDEIIAAIKELGITNLKEYQDFLNSEKNPFQPYTVTQEMIDNLSPDNVNNHDFWRACKDLFADDPVCNRLNKDLADGTPFEQINIPDIITANRRNRLLADFTGVLPWVQGLLRYRAGAPTKILEIGPGYGSFRNIIESEHYNVAYRGVDVFPLVPDTIQTNPDGTLPMEYFKEDEFDIVYSSNVFQHLSDRQRKTYFQDIFNILKPGSAFIFNMQMTFDKNMPNGEDGEKYMCHYGQFTRIPVPDEIFATLSEIGFKRSHYSVDARYLFGLFMTKPSTNNTDGNSNQ